MVERYRAMRIEAYVAKEEEQGLLRVTVLRNDEIVRLGETTAPYGAPLSTSFTREALALRLPTD